MSTPEEAARNFRDLQRYQQQLQQQIAANFDQSRQRQIQAAQEQLQSVREARERQEILQRQLLQRAAERHDLLQRFTSPIFSSTPITEQRTPEPELPSRRYVTFQDAGSLLQSGQITSFILDPQNQIDVPPGLTRITLIGTDGREYDVVARYDPNTNQIYPPQ